jgi:hypothetical protein
MSTTDPLLTTIEPDEVAAVENAPNARTQPQREQVVLTPTNRVQGNASASDMEAGKLWTYRFSFTSSNTPYRYLWDTEAGTKFESIVRIRCQYMDILVLPP